MSPSKKENSLVLAFYLDIRYLISFHKQCNRVLEGDIKKEPYRYRILDTRFYPISCISSSTPFTGKPFEFTTKKGSGILKVT